VYLTPGVYTRPACGVHAGVRGTVGGCRSFAPRGRGDADSAIVVANGMGETIVSYSTEQNAWTDGGMHFYCILPSDSGWTVTVHLLNQDGTVDLVDAGGEYRSEIEAWTAARERAERSAAGEQEE